MPPREPIACAAIDALLSADVDGDGCADALRVGDGVVEAAGRRWAVGHAGDVMATGDWNCRGRRTLAVLRPATGQVFRFDGWAMPGADVSAPAVARLPGATSMQAADVDGDGCHELVVHRGDQPPSLLHLDTPLP